MYEKNLTEAVRLRLSTEDMDFLRELSSQRSVSVSECIRSIIGEYKRSLELVDALKGALELSKGGAVHGDTKTNINDKL
jgi:hypothetical protein